MINFKGLNKIWILLFLAILVISTLSLSVRATTVDDFSQCANGQLPSAETGCEDWTSGNLNSQNSHYREDEVVPQRLVLDLTGGSLAGRSITLSYQTLKNSVHAFDSFAAWNLTQPTASRCQDLSVCPNGPISTFAIPDDTAAVPPSGDNISNITSNHMIPAGSGRLITMYGGTITGVSVPEHSGGNDDIATFTVTYSVPSLPTKVMFLFGSHLAASFGVRGWGDNLGASNINGGSYHITLMNADGISVGKRSNGIQAGSVLPQPGVITIKKVTIPSPDPTNESFNFSSVSEHIPDFSLANAQSTAFTLDSDTYNITESNPSPNFLLTDISCESDAGSGYSADIDTRSVYIILANAGNVTCMFTNTLQEPSLVIKKFVTNDNGGAALSSNFTIHVDATNPSSNDFAGSEEGTAITLEPGSYNVSEAGLDGYAAIYSPDCAGAISYGESKTCIITNDDVSPQLTVIKNVVNDNGGTAQSSDFTMNISAENPSLSSFPGSENGTTIALNAGLYNVLESGPNGYIANFSSECSGSISIGETKTCTIINDDNAATLTLTKTVINDNGGTLTAAEFELFVGETQVTSGQENVVLAGDYTVSENEVSGYEASAWGGDCNSDGAITLIPGDDKICTITNDDISPQLTVIKKVVNDDNGDKQSSDFTINVVGANVSLEQFQGSESGTTITLDAGNYSVSEDGFAGYSSSFSSECAGSIGLGENRTCIITNDDVTPQLTVLKHVINDNGGMLTSADFQLFINGSQINSGEVNSLPSGLYVVSENNVDGYLASSFGGDCNADGSITLAPGDNAICTITNDDIPAHLTVIKTVVNDDGGNLQVSDFQLFINNSQVNSGEANTLSAGLYTVSENNVDGYSASAFGGDCNEDGSITLSPGENAVCSITNDDIAPTLTVVKTVINDNGGALTVEDFPLFIDDEEVNSGQVNTLSAGTYVVSETNANGYEASSFGGDCNVDGTITLSLDQDAICAITNDDVPGQIHGTKFEDINGNGIWDEDEPGLSGWLIILWVDGDILDVQETDEDGNYWFMDLDAGIYTISEDVEEGWIQTLPFIPSYDINIELGTVSENNNFGNFELGSIHGTKFEDLNRNSQRDEEEPGLAGWTIYLDANENGILDEDEQSTSTDENGNYWFLGLDAQTYLVREALQDGWAQTFPQADYEVGIQSGIVSENNDFGNFKLATVNGFVFGDIDGDGIQDENETGLEGSNVIISRVNEIFNETANETVIETEIVALTLTGTDGSFSFTINESGQYRITSQNEGFETTYPLDSFFDVFVDSVSGTEITVDVNNDPIVFGNHKLPVINNDIAVENATTNSVVITWTTDVNSTSQVVYHIFPQDNVSGYVFSTEEFDVNLTVTNHSVTIIGLESNTTYFFRVVSGVTNSSPEAFSDEFSFTTLPLTITSSDDGPISTGGSGGSGGGSSSSGGGSSGGGGGGHYIWDCEEWSICFADGTQTRTCRYMNDVTVEITRVDTQSCTPQSSDDDSGSGSCLEVWTCADWSACSPDGTQTRVCADQNECGTYLYKPEESQFCVYEQDELEEGQPAITGFAITDLFKPSSFLWLLILLIILALMYYYYSEIYKKNIKK